jgi:hypothetical protein
MLVLDSAVVFLLAELDLCQPISTITIVVASPRDTKSCSRRRADLTALEVADAVIYYFITTDPPPARTSATSCPLVSALTPYYVLAQSALPAAWHWHCGTTYPTPPGA